MIKIKNKVAIQRMEMAGKLLSNIMDNIPKILVPGINTLEIDKWIDEQLKKNNLVSETKGYMGYKYSSCISVNDEVVHGIPNESKILVKGDLLKIDVCASWKNYCADMARCFYIGDEPPAQITKLLKTTQVALDMGISKAKPGNRLSDISSAIQQVVEENGFGVVRDFAGHGIGKEMHEDPEILNYGKPGMGPVLVPGMSFAIEPMVTLGNYSVFVDKDGWTVKTKDRSLAAHIEDTIVITEFGPKILTRNNGIEKAI